MSDLRISALLNELERVKEENQKLKASINEYETGFKGACHCCEVVGEMSLKLESENKLLRECVERIANHNIYALYQYHIRQLARETLDKIKESDV